MNKDNDSGFCVDIKSKNFTLTTKFGKIIRTPIKFYIKGEDKLFWEMQLLKAGIKDYKIIKLITHEVPVENTIIPIVTDELIRPSLQRKKE